MQQPKLGDSATVRVLNGDVEGAIRALRKGQEKAGLWQSIARHESAKSRGERARQKHVRAVARRKKLRMN
jgi:ribosomal protein S21